MGHNAAAQLLSADSVHIGGGVLLTSYLVVTANHCLRNAQIGDSIDIRIGGEPVIGKLVERAVLHDLALLEIPRPMPPVESAYARRGDAWFGPVRRNMTDPELSGTVVGRLEYECEAGGSLLAVQLVTLVDIGQYEGYSGGPVYRLPEENPAAIGVLLEQFPDQGSPRNTNTLFAACISEPFRLFRRLSYAWLVSELLSHNVDKNHGQSRTSSSNSVSGADADDRKIFDIAVDALETSMLDADAQDVIVARVGKSAMMPTDELR
jgi:hypothetical protein